MNSLSALPRFTPGKNDFGSHKDAHLPQVRMVALVGLILALGYAIVLGSAFCAGHFLLDEQGKPIANDFVNVWAAGRLALDGAPAAAYDWALHKAAEARAVGHAFANYYGWHYPPTFLFVAITLALLPYVAAAVVWLLATAAAYAATLSAILRSRAGALLALGFPATIWNITAGQNGFLTATLIGGSLSLLERHPVLAGMCLGLLSYKPQFGLLFPLVLIADRRWLALGVAALVALAVAAIAWLTFRTQTWQGFIHAAPLTARVVLGDGAAEFIRMQSLFALVRAQGGSEALAWMIHTTGVLVLATSLVVLWRSGAAYELKAAALAAGALLATPYVYIYDCVVLAIAVVFLLRFALTEGFAAGEIGGLAMAGALIFIYPWVKSQVGFAAALIILALVLRRAFRKANT